MQKRHEQKKGERKGGRGRPAGSKGSGRGGSSKRPQPREIEARSRKAPRVTAAAHDGPVPAVPAVPFAGPTEKALLGFARVKAEPKGSSDSTSGSMGRATGMTGKTSSVSTVDKHLTELDVTKILEGQSLGDKAYHCKRAIQTMLEKVGEGPEVVMLRAHHNIAQLAQEHCLAAKESTGWQR